ncbi:MAG: hypothetical protein KAX55_01210 [Propionivibrio sp.]|nr:hypothetical protein [Propionivibrio sp.]
MEKSILCFSQESRWADWTLTDLDLVGLHLVHERLHHLAQLLRVQVVTRRVAFGLLRHVMDI